MTENAPDWTRFWSKKIPFSSFLFYRIYERFRARGYFRLLKNLDLKNKSILELGGGSGYICSLICRKYKCKGKVIDNNEKAYEVFRKVVGEGNLDYVLGDMFDCRGKYDLVFSDGLIEHFRPGKRKELVLLHRKLARTGGFVMFFVPKKSWLVEHFMSMKGEYEEKMDIGQLERESSVPGLRLVSTTEDLHMIGVLYKVGQIKL